MRASSASTSSRSVGNGRDERRGHLARASRPGGVAPCRGSPRAASPPRASPPGGRTPDLASVASAAPIRRASAGVGSTGSPRTAPSHTVRVAAS